MSDIDYDSLDPGIRETVRWLRGIGMPTCDSGDGVSKPDDFECAIREPHVFMQFARLDTAVKSAHTIKDLLEDMEFCEGRTLPSLGVNIEVNYSPFSDDVIIVALTGVNDAMITKG